MARVKMWYRGFLIVMILLIALGAAMVIEGAARHANRPAVTLGSEERARVRPARDWMVGHV